MTVNCGFGKNGNCDFHLDCSENTKEKQNVLCHIIHLNTLFSLSTFPPKSENLAHFSQVLHFIEESVI